MKTVYIFFGEMGVGKNYHATQYAKYCDLPFWDADESIPNQNHCPLNKIIIHNFVNILKHQILHKANLTEYGLVVAQALYLDEERWNIKRYLEEHGIRTVFYYVKAPFIRNLKQLYARPNGLKQVWHWLINRQMFQRPTHDYRIVYHEWNVGW